MSEAVEPSTFNGKLAAAVAEVESSSAVELVVLLSPRSGTYPEAALLGGLLGLYLVFAIVMFQDAELGDSLIFVAPLAGLIVGALLVGFVGPLRRRLTFRAAIDRNVELVARASFQKAGLAATRDATAMLVYLSFEERRVFVVADRGVTRALGDKAIGDFRVRYSDALDAADPEVAILDATRSLKAPFAAALPPRPDDINEIPDVIDVVF